jgi:signal transduction histidine kinase
MLLRARRILDGRWFDGALAVVLGTVTELGFLVGYPHGHGSKPLLAALTAAMCSALIWRRRWPLAFVLWVSLFELVIGFTLLSVSEAAPSFWVLTIVPYTAAAYLPARTALLAVCVNLGASVAVGFPFASQPLQDAMFVLAVGLASAGLGRTVRSRRELDRALRHRTEQIAVEREDRVRLAIADERSRIARELHAVVANSVSAMVVQAAAAQRLLPGECEKADKAMDSIESTGRATLGEIRRMLGVLRDGSAGMPLAPQPSVGRLHELLESARAHGRRATLEVEGQPGPLPAAVELAVYRLAEDTLALASPGEPISLALRYGRRDLELAITGREELGVEWPSLAARERISLCGGSCRRAGGEDGSPAMLSVTLPRDWEQDSGPVAAAGAAQRRSSALPSPGLITPSS